MQQRIAQLSTVMSKRVDTVRMMIFSSNIMRNLMMDLLDLA